MDELSKETKKVQAIADSTDVLNTAEEIKNYNNLIEKSEMTTPEARLPSVDGN
ncbi:hypothetical protein [Paenibacillus puerhi]|uniref:hypothetical protein n=1 Tax=Paenibacillus puerhi TaxID=2692622 RepID=UPI001356FD47|nr:hypothetical protein [Paenibacillus puerhi]